jgi:hypothetical protein
VIAIRYRGRSHPKIVRLRSSGMHVLIVNTHWESKGPREEMYQLKTGDDVLFSYPLSMIDTYVLLCKLLDRCTLHIASIIRQNYIDSCTLPRGALAPYAKNFYPNWRLRASSVRNSRLEPWRIRTPNTDRGTFGNGAVSTTRGWYSAPFRACPSASSYSNNIMELAQISLRLSRI